MADSEEKKAIQTWTPEIEAMIKYYGNNSNGYFYMLREEHRVYTVFYAWIINAVIVCGLGGVFFSTFNQWTKKYDSLNIFSNILFIFTTFLTAILKHKSFETKITEYKRYMVKFTSFSSNIRRQLSLDVSSREKPNNYINWITSSYAELCETMPDISVSTQVNFRKTAQQNGWSYPDEQPFTLEKMRMGEFIVPIASVDVPLELSKTPLPLTLQSEAHPFADASMEYELKRLDNA
jgi:hypothetical protein